MYEKDDKCWDERKTLSYFKSILPQYPTASKIAFQGKTVEQTF